MDLIVGLGSNMGDRPGYLKKALQTLEKEVGILVKKSSIMETEPWGFEANENFLNMVAWFATDLSAKEVLAKCQSIEKNLGRIRSQNQRYTSRTIDVDILFYGDCILNTTELVIPHPLIAYRNFVLYPLQEIIPEFTHPVLQCKIKDMLLQTLPSNNTETN